MTTGERLVLMLCVGAVLGLFIVVVMLGRDVGCPKLEAPATLRIGTDYGLRLVRGGRCPTYQLVPIYGRTP